MDRQMSNGLSNTHTILSTDFQNKTQPHSEAKETQNYVEL